MHSLTTRTECDPGVMRVCKVLCGGQEHGKSSVCVHVSGHLSHNDVFQRTLGSSSRAEAERMLRRRLLSWPPVLSATHVPAPMQMP